MHLRNQTRQTLEIKIVIGEIKRDKFKIKMTIKTKRLFPINHSHRRQEKNQTLNFICDTPQTPY